MNENRNYGDQVRDAIQDAIERQDYSNLVNVVERSIGGATEAIGAGLREASQAAQVASVKHREVRDRLAAQAEQQRVQSQNRAAIRGRFNSPSMQTAIGWIASVAGGLVAGSAGLLILVCLPFLIMEFDAAGVAAIIVLAAFAVAGGVGLRFGVKKLGLVKRFRLYQNALGLRQHCAVEELAAQAGVKPGLVMRDLRKLISMGLFRQGHLNDRGTHLMVTDYAYAQYRAANESDKLAAQQQELRARRAEQRLQDPALDAEARAILNRGESFIAQIRESNDAIAGAEISAKIDQIESVVRSIFEYAEEHPEVIPELDRLMDYYLPTTVKLLDAYEDLDRQPVHGQNILKSKAEIEATLDTLNAAFAKLLDSIFSDVAWDVSTDVSVLHAVLAQEGLAENPFEAKPKPKLTL